MIALVWVLVIGSGLAFLSLVGACALAELVREWRRGSR